MCQLPRRTSSTVSSPTFVLCVISIAIALHGVVNLATCAWKPVENPNVSKINAQFCLWRAHDTCWASPNVSLTAYELLFPVTREVLLQRQIVQRFQPLELRYDVAVVWNAMTQCRMIYQRTKPPFELEHTTLFASLPSNSSVDLWCGASLLGGDEMKPLSTVWFFPSDAMISPFEAHKTAFLNEVTKRDPQERIKMGMEGVVALAFAVALFLGRVQLVSCWKHPRTKKTRGLLVVNPRAREQTTGTRQRDRENETTDLPPDPTWIDLQAPALE